jgi:hypothetical protein
LADAGPFRHWSLPDAEDVPCGIAGVPLADSPPSRDRSDLPEDLERVVLQCLAKDPTERFPDAESLERALAACACAGEWDQERAAEWWQDIEAGSALMGSPPESLASHR